MITSDIIKDIKKKTFFLYAVVYSLFFISFSFFDYNLGYGLGDAIYFIGFTLWMVITSFLSFVVKSRNWSYIISILNFLIAIYIILMMFVFRGAESNNF